MITLYTFGPYFGLPDTSPFVIKAMLLLKFAGLPFEETATVTGGRRKASCPISMTRAPFVPDSAFIRFHIEQKYGFDFDAGLRPEQKAAAWAMEKMCEEHLYFALVATRWCDDENFAKGPALFFKAIPAPVRPVVQTLVRRKVRKTLNLQGLGRHTQAEQDRLAIADVDALSALIGDKPYLMGETPCGADAAVFGFVASFLAPAFTTNVRAAAEKHQNLTDYRDRVLRQYFAS